MYLTLPLVDGTVVTVWALSWAPDTVTCRARGQVITYRRDAKHGRWWSGKEVVLTEGPDQQ